MPHRPEDNAWPALPYAQWADTCETLHLWCQILGKVRLAQTPWLNHSWQTPLYVSARGLTSGVIPHRQRVFDLELDFVDHVLRVRTDESEARIALQAGPVAAFFAQIMDVLAALGVPVAINVTPNEMTSATPFPKDIAPRVYDPLHAERFWRVLLRADRVLKAFRTGFLGKASQVHFFWGSFDLAVTRFSGRAAPRHPGGVPNLPDAVVREAYSHEVSSAGFWPGGPGDQDAAFYSYAWPEPVGYRNAVPAPSEARFDAALGEFVLPYDAVRNAADPEGALMAFLSSTYAAAAELGHWDRGALECELGAPGRPRPT